MRTGRLHPPKELEPAELERRAFDFAAAITRLAISLREELPGPALDGLAASAAKTGAEAANAQENPSRRHALSHFTSARRAAYEAIYWLKLAAAAGALNPETAGPLVDEAGTLHDALTAMCARLHKQVES